MNSVGTITVSPRVAQVVRQVRGIGLPALHGCNSRDLPPAEDGVWSAGQASEEALSPADRKFVEITYRQVVTNIGRRRAFFRRDVVGVLDVPGHVAIRRSQALPQRVRREDVEAVCKSVIHGGLEGIVRDTELRKIQG